MANDWDLHNYWLFRIFGGEDDAHGRMVRAKKKYRARVAIVSSYSTFHTIPTDFPKVGRLKIALRSDQVRVDAGVVLTY
jgi:hypothetical protein